MSTVQLGWRLAWSGGRFRALAVVAGNAIASCLFLLTVALPVAIRPAGPVTSDARLQAVSVLLCLCLPITVLAMSLGRLSASTRDRRLAALRLLGLSPARTRLVAGTENAILAGAGVLLGLAGAVAAAPLVTHAVAGHGWLHRPLRLSPAATAAAGVGLVVLAVVVSLAPTRALARGSLGLRHEGTTAPPSLWRLVPLAVGFGALVGTLLWIRPDTDLTGVMVMLGGAGLTGVGVVLALPVAVGVAANLLTRRHSGTSVRLAARRLQIESGAAVRMAAGVTIAAFVITSALGVLTAFKATPQYQAQHHALTRGPQLDLVFLPDPPSLAPDLDPHAVRRHLLATPGVRAVIADYGIEAAPSDTCGPDEFCGEVFVGTCDQLALLQAVPGCRDDTISLITSTNYTQHSLAHPITLTGNNGRRARIQPSPTILTADEAATHDRHPGTLRYSLFIPAGASQIASLTHDPTSYHVLTGPGVVARQAVQAAGDDLGVTVILDDLEDYQAVQGYQLLITTLAVIILGVGLLAVLLTTIDRAIERRRHIASQVALGVPVRILRGSQLLQTLIPLWLGLIGAVGLGSLTVAAYIRLTGVSDTMPTTTILTVGTTALAAAAIIATVTLPGISRRLTPDLLRRE